jgi:hypothetical protein
VRAGVDEHGTLLQEPSCGVLVTMSHQTTEFMSFSFSSPSPTMHPMQTPFFSKENPECMQSRE